MTNAIDRIPNSIFRVISAAVITLLLGMIIFPLYFMAITAFKVEREIYSELTWIPQNPTLENFYNVFYNFGIPLYLRNTLIVASMTTVLVVIVSILASYALTRLRFPGRAGMARGVLFVYLVPSSLMLIPMYLIIVQLGLKDTYTGLVVANMSFSVPFCTWLLMGYLRSISAEMEEASLIDGCTRLMSLWYIGDSAFGAGHRHRRDLYLQQRLERVYLRPRPRPGRRPQDDLRRAGQLLPRRLLHGRPHDGRLDHRHAAGGDFVYSGAALRRVRPVGGGGEGVGCIQFSATMNAHLEARLSIEYKAEYELHNRSFRINLWVFAGKCTSEMICSA